ncbi:MAG: hypothetical protein DHS20C18_22160 [Saprospiraceae bacterium]|nr:MAG: hypothetical protein DHS20C18_22160 [Saprospiraceae bacterium]
MNMIWKKHFDLEALNAFSKDTMVDTLGIEFTEIGDDYLTARMPVDKRTVQPMRLLHGGASVTLAETLGSIASQFSIADWEKNMVVGVEINANHLNSVRAGFVTGKVTPIKVGNRLHVWQIEIKNESGELICVSRLTVAVIARRE